MPFSDGRHGVWRVALPYLILCARRRAVPGRTSGRYETAVPACWLGWALCRRHGAVGLGTEVCPSACLHTYTTHTPQHLLHTIPTMDTPLPPSITQAYHPTHTPATALPIDTLCTHIWDLCNCHAHCLPPSHLPLDMGVHGMELHALL